MTPFGKQRLEYQPQLPICIACMENVVISEGESIKAPSEKLAALFPLTNNQPRLLISQGDGASGSGKALKIGVVFSGGQAAGGHNVITGLLDSLIELDSKSELIGFIGGPSGIVNNTFIQLNKDLIAPYRNQGGFDLIGSGRTKIETQEQFAASLRTVQENGLDGLVIIGGDDSNTNAAFLAEYFAANGCRTNVVGVPKTIDGDLVNEEIETSFGFDTATKTFAATIGDIQRDALSAGKYYFFIKIMGRSASHVALQCALMTQPNMTLIGEEVAAKGMTLTEVAEEIAEMIVKRAAKGLNHGVVLIPEGIIEFIPEVKTLITELNALEAKGEGIESLSQRSATSFSQLPQKIQEQLLLDRDPHGNVQVSKIETERLFIAMVADLLKNRFDYRGAFNAQPHFCGYEGRSCYPSNFDANYCYALGRVATLLIQYGASGYMACVGNLKESPSHWTAKGIPILGMMTIESRKGKEKAVIAKALVDLGRAPFTTFALDRSLWLIDDHYLYPGPIQY